MNRLEYPRQALPPITGAHDLKTYNRNSSVAHAKTSDAQLKRTQADDDIAIDTVRVTSFSEICLPEILSKISDYIDISDRSMLRLNQINKHLRNDDVIRSKALECISMNLFSSHKVSDENAIVIFSELLKAIKQLPPDLQIAPLSRLIDNRKTTVAGMNESVYTTLAKLRNLNMVKDLTSLIRLQIRSGERFASSKFIAILVPNEIELPPLLAQKLIDPGKIIQSVIRSLPNVSKSSHEDMLRSIHKYFNRHLSARQKSAAFEDFISVIHLFEGELLYDAIDEALKLLPHYIKYDISENSDEVVEHISILQKNTLTLNEELQFPIMRSIISMFPSLSAHTSIRTLFRNAAADAMNMPDYELEPMMKTLYSELGRCGLMHDHELCYSIAAIIDRLHHPCARDACIQFAGYLPMYTQRGKLTKKMVISDINRRFNEPSRKVFLKHVKRYFSLVASESI